jgi:hypothetical protein
MTTMDALVRRDARVLVESCIGIRLVEAEEALRPLMTLLGARESNAFTEDVIDQITTRLVKYVTLCTNDGQDVFTTYRNVADALMPAPRKRQRTLCSDSDSESDQADDIDKSVGIDEPIGIDKPFGPLSACGARSLLLADHCEGSKRIGVVYDPPTGNVRSIYMVLPNPRYTVNKVDFLNRRITYGFPSGAGCAQFRNKLKAGCEIRALIVLVDKDPNVCHNVVCRVSSVGETRCTLTF